jgi:glycosyltransferase involved in cell wall biosynthesis
LWQTLIPDRFDSNVGIFSEMTCQTRIKTKRIVFCWDVVNGYMASCWRALAKRNDVALQVYAIEKNTRATPFTYADHVLQGFSSKLFQVAKLNERKFLVDELASFKPDILFISGWNIPAYVELITNKHFAAIPKVMTMDTNYLGTWRQILAPLKIRRYLKKVDMVFVPGERSRQLARYWKIPEHKIRTGSYAMDFQSFSKAMKSRLELPEWPRKFLFAGQYIERKGVPFLMEAYKKYRMQVDDPWPLICCGAGPMEADLRNCKGIDERGFAQPKDLPGIMAEAGAFVHPSLYDPWGVAIAEACAAGLPVLATQSCASSVELIRDYANGVILPTGDVRALCDGMIWIHEHHGHLSAMGRQSWELARPFSAEAWVKRVKAIAKMFN